MSATKPPWSQRGSLPTTRKTLFERARDLKSPEVARKALGELFGLYLGPISAYLETNENLDREGADECAQDFIATQMVEKDLLNENRGKFRNYLKGALFNFMNAQRRDEDCRVEKESHPRSGPGRKGKAEERFDSAFVRECIDWAFAGLHATHPDHAEVLYRLHMSETEVTYRELAAELGYTVSNIRNLQTNAKKRLALNLKKTLEEMLGDLEEADIALKTLFAGALPWLNRRT